MAWKEYCAECWSKEHGESMDRCTGRRDMTEILLKTALNINHCSHDPTAKRTDTLPNSKISDLPKLKAVADGNIIVI